MSSLPDIATLATLPPPAVIAALDLLFEPTPDLHALVLPLLVRTSFPSYPALIDTIRHRLHALVVKANDPGSPDQEETKRALHGILGSHPRLGAPKEGEVLSEQSRQEQRNLKAGPPGEAEELARLNQEYEAVFPGLRYVVFVNGRGRKEVMEDMRRRIAVGREGGEGAMEGEERRGVDAMCDIALDRARKLGQVDGGVV